MGILMNFHARPKIIYDSDLFSLLNCILSKSKFENLVIWLSPGLFFYERKIFPFLSSKTQSNVVGYKL